MKKVLVAALLFFLSAVAVAQQDYVGRYDAYGGFSYLSAPDIRLGQWGFNTQEGVNVKRWLAFGFDYSIQTGSTTLRPGELNDATLAKLAPLVSGLPAGYNLFVPFDATTQTFAAGPQLEYRHFKRFTLFVHPSIGAIHESIDLKAHDTITAELLAALPELGVAAGPKLHDTTYFYGVGGGADFNATKHLHFRCDLEYVHTFLFSDLLAQPRNAIRVSVGPTFNFGGNVAQ
ncbi:MAG: outer membrane beta-barrel protein [Candidatus Korobacteraceae bacterium]